MYSEPTIVSSSLSFQFVKPSNLTIVNDLLYFTLNDSQQRSYALWRTDGTEDGTVAINNSDTTAISHLTNINGTLYFQADGLWQTDGDPGNTVLVDDTVLAKFNGEPNLDRRTTTQLQDNTYFVANGHQLWETDGSLEAGVLIQDLDVAPQSLFTIQDRLFFTTSRTIQPYPNIAPVEIGTIDGITGAAETLVVLPAGGIFPTVVSDFRALDDGTLFFNTYNDFLEARNYSLWTSDGTPDGTSIVARSFGPPIVSGVLNNQLIFGQSFGQSDGSQLWQSDGTTDGTVLIKQIAKGFSPIGPFSSNLNGWLFFTADDGVNGAELWRTDGTTDGTFLVKDIAVGAASSSPHNLTIVNDRLYFTAGDGVNGWTVWVSDGSAAGTTALTNVPTSTQSYGPTNLINVNGVLYFTASDGGDRRLWKIDPPAAPEVALPDSMQIEFATSDNGDANSDVVIA